MKGPKMNELLAILQSRFPDAVDTIKHRLEEDPILLEISENHQDCIAALQHWRKSNAPEAEARISEYQVIARELEQEALDTLGLQL
jgi:hypothetical protein